jgi:hypothetical protein
MACKKSEIVQAINTYGNARSSNDPNLVNYASQLLVNYLDTLEFEPEPEPTEEELQAPAE